MAVAFDVYTQLGNGTTDISATHTPSGTPRGVVVFVVQGAGGTDEVSGVTYGGTAMTEVAGSPNAKAAAEAGVVYAYFLGSSVPTGAQTVTVTVSGASAKVAGCYTVTAAADTTTEDVDASINSDSVTDPSATLSLNGKTCFCCQAVFTGLGAIGGGNLVSNWSDAAGSGGRLDFGPACASIQRFLTDGSTDVTMGYVQTTEDAVIIGVAVTESAGAADPEGSLIAGKLLRGGLLLHGVLGR